MLFYPCLLGASATEAAVVYFNGTYGEDSFAAFSGIRQSGREIERCVQMAGEGLYGISEWAFEQRLDVEHGAGDGETEMVVNYVAQVLDDLDRAACGHLVMGGMEDVSSVEDLAGLVREVLAYEENYSGDEAPDFDRLVSAVAADYCRYLVSDVWEQVEYAEGVIGAVAAGNLSGLMDEAMNDMGRRFVEECRQTSDAVPSLDGVRAFADTVDQMLAAYPAAWPAS